MTSFGRCPNCGVNHNWHDSCPTRGIGSAGPSGGGGWGWKLVWTVLAVLVGVPLTLAAFGHFTRPAADRTAWVANAMDRFERIITGGLGILFAAAMVIVLVLMSNDAFRFRKEPFGILMLIHLVLSGSACAVLMKYAGFGFVGAIWLTVGGQVGLLVLLALLDRARR